MRRGDLDEGQGGIDVAGDGGYHDARVDLAEAFGPVGLVLLAEGKRDSMPFASLAVAPRFFLNGASSAKKAASK